MFGVNHRCCQCHSLHHVGLGLAQTGLSGPVYEGGMKNPVEVIITVKECLVNLVSNHCRLGISIHSNQTAYFPDSTVPYAKHSVQLKFVIDIHSDEGVISQCLI